MLGSRGWGGWVVGGGALSNQRHPRFVWGERWVWVGRAGRGWVRLRQGASAAPAGRRRNPRCVWVVGRRNHHSSLPHPAPTHPPTAPPAMVGGLALGGWGQQRWRLGGAGGGRRWGAAGGGGGAGGRVRGMMMVMMTVRCGRGRSGCGGWVAGWGGGVGGNSEGGWWLGGRDGKGWGSAVAREAKCLAI